MGNQQQQPSFLAQIAAKKKGSGTDPGSKRKRGSETEKNQPRTRGHEGSAADATPKTMLTTAVPSTTFTPPPPPSDSSRVPRPILWESGVVSALSTAIRAPDRFCDPYFTKATQEELKTIEFNALKAASLLGSLQSMQSRFGKTVDELQVCREEKKKTYEELLKAKEDYKRTNHELLNLQRTHAMNSKSLSDFKVIHEDLEKKFKAKETALKESLDQMEKIKREKQEAELDADKCRDALKVGVQGSFENALNQIKIMNPGIDLNLSGVHFMSYVHEGQIVAVPPSSPVADSVTIAGGIGGEDDDAEVTGRDKPVDVE